MIYPYQIQKFQDAYDIYMCYSHEKSFADLVLAHHDMLNNLIAEVNQLTTAIEELSKKLGEKEE